MNEMTLLEMQKALKGYCRDKKCCYSCNISETNCPLINFDCEGALCATDYNLTLKAYNIVFGKEKTEMKKEFTKADLESRMLVELRNGGRYIVTDTIIVDETGFLRLSNYNNDLLDVSDRQWDIVKVFGKITALRECKYPIEKLNLLWQRPEPKKMTKTEIEKELGYKIEIVE